MDARGRSLVKPIAPSRLLEVLESLVGAGA